MCRGSRRSIALLFCSLGWVLGACPRVVAAQPWLPLVRESRAQVIAEVFFEAQSIREIDPGVFEIRLLYDPVASTCVRRNRDGECAVDPDRLLASKRITVIRIRCGDMSYEEVAMWVGGPLGWQQLWAMDFRNPPGWRYNIASSTAVAAARDLVCVTVPR
jgi:hypothetical protein